MAELIPLEYRIGVAQQEAVRRWGFIAALAATIAGGAFFYAFNGQRKEHALFDQRNRDYTLKAMIKVESRQLVERREEMAKRMAKIQEVQDDQLLLSLLRTVSQEFSDNDVLDDVALEVHGRAGDERTPAGSFAVRVSGVTKNYESWTELVDRLTKTSVTATPPMAIKPGSSSDAKVLDGMAIRFQINCEPPAPKLAEASEGGK